jgi:RNA polymerase sigma factor (sigma-70 family)
MSAFPEDTRAFDVFYDRYAPAVARFAWSVSPTADVAQDILQETFLTAWDKRRAIRLVEGSALPWLLTTCRNHARNHARRERRWSELLQLREESLVADPVDGDAAADLRWALEAVAGLPDGERAVTELVLLRGLSYREAGEALGLSDAAVGKRLQRARTRLREGTDG